jgi:hypothetical protein
MTLVTQHTACNILHYQLESKITNELLVNKEGFRCINFKNIDINLDKHMKEYVALLSSQQL